jgi:hypothetical protein
MNKLFPPLLVSYFCNTNPWKCTSTHHSGKGLYWFAFSNYIPENWEWEGDTTEGYNEVVYQFQLQGNAGYGRPPVIGVRNEGHLQNSCNA